MIAAFISLALLVSSSSAGTLHAELLVGADIKPLKELRVVFSNDPLGRSYEAEWEAHPPQNGYEIPSWRFGAYAIGKIPEGVAIETRLAGDKIVAIPVLATLRDKELILSYGYCSFPRSPGLVRMNMGMSIVQWLIHDVPWSNYHVTFKATDLGECSPP